MPMDALPLEVDTVPSVSINPAIKGRKKRSGAVRIHSGTRIVADFGPICPSMSSAARLASKLATVKSQTVVPRVVVAAITRARVPAKCAKNSA